MKITSRDLYPLAIICIFALIANSFITTINATKSDSVNKNKDADLILLRKKRVSLFRSSSTLGFFCADNGEFSGMGELHYISLALQLPMQHHIAECGNVTSGFITSKGSGAQIPSLIVTTGISALNAAMCTMAIQQEFQLKAILYIGTSGWSQFVGGLNPEEGCQRLPSKQSSSTRGPSSLGSVCITNAAASYACGLCVHNNSVAHTSECSRPSCNSRDSESLFGPCTFHAPTNSLASGILNIARSLTLPPMNTLLQQLTHQYWSAQSKATGGSTITPVVPSIHQDCLEMDMQKIDASGPVDYLCREYVADILNKYKLGSKPDLTADDVNCVGAMEGIGFLRAIYGRNPNTSPMNPGVQIAIIRGASNWDTYPLAQTSWTEDEKKAEPNLPSSKWVQLINYTSAEEHGKLTTQGYQYAILTTNTIALKYVDSL